MSHPATPPRPSAASSRDPDQLELFASEPAESHPFRDPTVVRALVPPGWWAYVQPLLAEALVHLCREVDGRLEIVATALPPADDAELQEDLDHLRRAITEMCICCGQRGAVRRQAPGGRIVVACERCWPLLQGRQSVLAVADQFFHLDGSRRMISRAIQPDAPRRPEVPVPSNGLRECGTMAPAELRAVAAEFRRTMAARVVAQEEAVARLATLAALHVGGGTPGSRALVVGPSGVGKTSLLSSLEAAFREGRFDVAVVRIDCIELQSPGWSGAPSIGEVIAGALGDTPLDSVRARRLVVILDEIHHIRTVDVPGGAGSSTSIGAKRAEILASLLGLTARDGVVNVGKDSYRPWSSGDAMIIALGAFTDLLDLSRDPTIADLAPHLGLELASRFEQVIRLRPIPEEALVGLLKRWPALIALTELAARLGLETRIHEEAYRRAARAVAQGRSRSTPRTAGGWLVAALQRSLDRALVDSTVQELVVTPDDLPISTTEFRRPPEEPPEQGGDWDATIILTPR